MAERIWLVAFLLVFLRFNEGTLHGHDLFNVRSLKTISASKEDTQIAKRKKRRKKRRRRKKRSSKKKISKKNYDIVDSEMGMSKRYIRRNRRKRWYYIAGLSGYYPFNIDFMPVIEAEDPINPDMQKAAIKYSPGFAVNFGVGRRFHMNYGAEGIFSVVYPIISSRLGVVREGEEAQYDGAVTLSFRAVFKYFFGIVEKMDYYAGLGAGYSQIFKDSPVEREGMILGGPAGWLTAGVQRYLSKKVSICGNVELGYIRYTYLDFWRRDLTDAAKEKGVTLGQIVVSAGISVTYRI